MRVLLTNDDGFHSPLFQYLVTTLQSNTDTDITFTVYAPAQNQSGISFASSNHDIRVKMHSQTERSVCYIVDGTPVDCVRIAAQTNTPFDLCISGINNGPNIGSTYLYSGTVAAAIEATNFGIPSIALSTYRQNDHSSFLAAFIRPLLSLTSTQTLKPYEVLNINTPNTKTIEGVRICTPGISYWGNDVIPSDEDGCYRYRFQFDDRDKTDPNTDVYWIHNGFATVTTLSKQVLPKPDIHPQHRITRLFNLPNQ